MTEKRFVNENEGDIRDTSTMIIYYCLSLTGKELCDLLNEQDERIKELKEIIIKITHSYHQKHDNTIVNLVDEVYEENIGDLFIELNHGDVE